MVDKIKKVIMGLSQWLQPAYKVMFIEDLPEDLKNGIVYIVGIKKHPWQAAFICPCGCGVLIQLSLLSNSNPRWKFRLYRKKYISLSPSIWRKVGCKSHFFIRKGNIVWAVSRMYKKSTK